jgi:hypothetical protein
MVKVVHDTSGSAGNRWSKPRLRTESWASVNRPSALHLDTAAALAPPLGPSPLPGTSGAALQHASSPTDLASNDTRLQDRRMRVGVKTLATVWRQAIADAELDASQCVVFLVKARKPSIAAEAGYFRPGRPDLPHSALRPMLFRWLDPSILDKYEDRHRVAVWAWAGRAPACALGPLLRHELQHAVHWQRWGPTIQRT